MDTTTGGRMAMFVLAVTLGAGAAIWWRWGPLSAVVLAPMIFIGLVLGSIGWSVWRS